jgi:hypothetical protein
MGVTGGDDSTIRFWKLFPDLAGRDPAGSDSGGVVGNNENFRVGKGACGLSRNRLEKYGAKRGNLGIPTIR